MRKKALQTITMAAGILTALVVVVSQLFFFQTPQFSKKETSKLTADTKADKKENKQTGDEHYITLPSVSQPSPSATVEADQKSCCLLEIVFEERKSETHSINVTRTVGKFFTTLFRVIISP